MQAVNNAHLNTNTSGPTTLIPQSLYSGSFSNALATSVNFLGPTKTLSDSEYLTFTSSELQNGQLMPTNSARNIEMPTNCLVCGLPTKSCHYDVPSCHGCKTFFRRALIASKTYTCKFNGMCSKINGIDRCRACRFDKCVLVGMNPRAMQIPTSVDVAKLSDRVSNRRTSPVFEETMEDKIIQSLIYVELKARQIRESSRWLSESVMFRSIRELLESNHENVLSHADQYPKELTWPLTIDEASRSEGSEGRPNGLMLDMFLCIEMEALLKHATLANEILLQAFYSFQMNSETIVMPNGFAPTRLPRFYRVKGIMARVKLLAYRTMVAISRIQMTMEEFVLLKAVIYSHSGKLDF
ncbi:zinc finger, c4 type (two domains) domain-containing protein [Ditylenchus destructor]|nr:zinc finger, c4 type (two domains) domain-containing protein [Ditylenchus destructor]